MAKKKREKEKAKKLVKFSERIEEQAAVNYEDSFGFDSLETSHNESPESIEKEVGRRKGGEVLGGRGGVGEGFFVLCLARIVGLAIFAVFFLPSFPPSLSPLSLNAH